MKRFYGPLSLVGALSLLGSILGYVRYASVVSVFGLSGESDAYFVAILIPTTLQAILAMGALSPALVHAYVNYIEAGRTDDARDTFSSVVNLAALVVAALAAAGVLFSRQVTSVTAPGLPADAERLSAQLMTFTLPVSFFLCLAALLGPILNTRGHFFAPALASVVLNLFTIGFIVVGAGFIGIKAAAIGILIGSATHVAILAVFLRVKGISYSLTLRLTHPGVRKVLRASAPAGFYTLVAYSGLFLERLLASFQGEGAVSIITLAATAFALPSTVFNASLGVVIYPQFVRLAATARNELAEAMVQASRLVLLVLIPATFLMVAACVPLTRLAYGPGDVSAAHVRTGGAVLAAYVFCLSAVGLTRVLQKGIYAHGDFVTPLKVEMMTLALYAALAIGLIQFWSIVGLGIARAAAFASCMLLTFWMARRLPAIPSLKEMAAYSAKPLLGGAAAAAFYATAFLLVDRAHPSPSYILTAAEQTVLLAVSGGVCLAVCGLLGVREARAVWRLVPVTKLRERALLVIGNVSAGPRIRTDRVFGALKRLSPNGKSVLDAGCAEGNGAIRCAALYPDSDVVGCDIDDSALQRAEARRDALGLRRLRFRTGDITSDLGDSCYDIILCVDVLEHIESDELAMRTLYRALKPGGHLVIHVPATPPRRIFPWLRAWHYTGHVRDGYSPEGLFAQLQANGLSVDRAQGTFGRAGAFAWEVSETLRSIVPPLRFLAFPVVAMGAVLDRNTPTAKGNGLLVIAHRSASEGGESAGEEISGGGKAGGAPAFRRLRTVEDGAES